MTQIKKFIRICPQEVLSQRVKRLRKNVFVCFYADRHSPGLDDTQKEERLRENEEGLNQNSSRSASRRASTEQR
jgi:hypothetical protein